VLMTAAALAIALTTAYLVLLVIGGVQVAGTATYVHLKWVPVAGVAVLALVGSALLAAGIGRLLPSPITPPVLAVAALALEVAALHAKWLLLTPGFREVDIQVFTSVVLPVTLAQALWFLGFGATGFALLFAVSGRTRLFAVLPLAVAAVVAVPVVSTVADPAVPDPDAQTLVCDEHGPRVCVTIAHADYLSALTGPARKALALLHKLPSPPTSVVEMGMPRPRRSDPDVVPMFIDPGRLPDPDTVRWQVLVRSAQPLCGPEGDDIVLSVTATQVIVSSWLTDAPTPISAPGQEYEWEYAHAEIKEGWAVLKALPPDRQAARVAEMRRAALDCRVFDLGTR
jgi:hypothetical protein